MMQKYYIPPQLDYVTYEDIHPFIMYIIEFNSRLSKSDLANIWQGLLPDLGLRVEKQSVELSHPMGPHEFFGGHNIPKDTRWMVFKVKQRAEKNYFKTTEESRDDARFQFDVDGRFVPYSYNWPYDNFSLIETARINAGLEIIKEVDDIGSV